MNDLFGMIADLFKDEEQEGGSFLKFIPQSMAVIFKFLLAILIFALGTIAAAVFLSIGSIIFALLLGLFALFLGMFLLTFLVFPIYLFFVPSINSCFFYYAVVGICAPSLILGSALKEVFLHVAGILVFLDVAKTLFVITFNYLRGKSNSNDLLRIFFIGVRLVVAYACLDPEFLMILVNMHLNILFAILFIFLNFLTDVVIVSGWFKNLISKDGVARLQERMNIIQRPEEQEHNNNLVYDSVIVILFSIIPCSRDSFIAAKIGNNMVDKYNLFPDPEGAPDGDVPIAPNGDVPIVPGC